MQQSHSPIILGNWKMNSSSQNARVFFETFKNTITNKELEKALVGFAPPFTLLDKVSSFIKEFSINVILGSQNIHWAESGAHTGEISASQLKEFNTKFAIIGHSERRTMYGEKNEHCAKRTIQAIKEAIIPVLCIGENESEYKAGKTKEVVTKQLHESLSNVKIDVKENHTYKLIIAYEPVWAIGTGLSAEPSEANTICKLIKAELFNLFGLNIPVLYGGSVDDKNTSSLIEQDRIDGFLVGGASLKPEVFSSIIRKSTT